MGKSYILDRYISIYIGGKPMLDLENILAHNKEFLATTKDTVAAEKVSYCILYGYPPSSYDGRGYWI